MLMIELHCKDNDEFFRVGVANAGTGGIRSAACGHRGGLPRASAPARIQKASLSHSLRNIGDVAMRRCTSAVKNQATLVCASGGCMSGKQPTVGITKVHSPFYFDLNYR